MNNFNVDITSKGDIEPAMALAFRKHGIAVGFSVQEVDRKEDVTSWTPKLSREQRLVFFWAEPNKKEGFKPLPNVGSGTAAAIATRWLDLIDYGPEPDHEGSNGKGWRIYNEAWGMWATNGPRSSPSHRDGRCMASNPGACGGTAR